MIDIDHETRSAYTENLTIPGEEAVLLEPNMDQIDHKLSAPNMTGRIASDPPLCHVPVFGVSDVVYLDVDKIEFER